MHVLVYARIDGPQFAICMEDFIEDDINEAHWVRYGDRTLA